MKERALYFIGGAVVGCICLSMLQPSPIQNESPSAIAYDPSLDLKIVELKKENQILNAKIQALESAPPTAIGTQNDNQVASQSLDYTDETPQISEPTVPSQKIQDEAVISAIANQTVLPTSRHIATQLNLDDASRDALQQLLQQKATQDYLAWNASAAEPLQAQEQIAAKLDNNTQEYIHALHSILTSEQIENYTRIEQQQAEIQLEQKQLSLRQALVGIDLDDFQQQEVARLSKALYSKNKVELGSMGSPYGMDNIQVNNDVLSEIKSLFTEAQLKKLNM
ncbi:hypothetical protein [Pseudoalteromonas luteoviolacea]|uniref:Uncharacterized protein n=1 Tax=Pseudoalteromonas luteoviolacea (strain 2ta16) TaxID=1353533 RepID=V4GZM8_PSEL2|nr:hypothetical protein [Pseudoalteromonas luteoviolacea]ESP90651.1 hypothetical protein PL2TA16_01755 [Pseudoalteromonas luteoviolacea 2ta16]KZN41773.1 hypothetical protein N483_13970 [Pseudoalteromonas luteoviolacea NCIMB 1944]